MRHPARAATLRRMFTTESCPGTDRWAPIETQRLKDDTEAPSGARWIGLCPVCGAGLELGYAGLLPPHTRAIPTDARPHHESAWAN
jgi:hypothetical protein